MAGQFCGNMTGEKFDSAFSRREVFQEVYFFASDVEPTPFC